MYPTAFGINVASKEGKKGGLETMNVMQKGKIEFNPQKDLLGKAIERNRTGHHPMTGLKGL